jgi:HEAT repeat protein
MNWRELFHDYVSPVRVNALKKLANDRDPRIGEGLVRAASDTHTTVRVAALSAIARHGEPGLISAIEPHMTDKKAAVRYTAAAAVLRLSALIAVDDTATTQRK